MGASQSILRMTLVWRFSSTTCLTRSTCELSGRRPTRQASDPNRRSRPRHAGRVSFAAVGGSGVGEDAVAEADSRGRIVRLGYLSLYGEQVDEAKGTLRVVQDDLLTHVGDDVASGCEL